MLIPRADSMPFFQGSAIAESRRHEYERVGCDQYAYEVRPQHLPEICQKYQNSIGFYTYNGVFCKFYKSHISIYIFKLYEFFNIFCMHLQLASVM